MKPESGSLVHVAALSVITSDFSTQKPASGFRLNDKKAAARNYVSPGTVTSVENILAIWS
jgi:hypothetical protein